MRKILALAFVLILCLGTALNAKPKDTFVEYNYELSLVKENTASTSGMKVFKVWSYGKRELLTQEICMRNAIHGLLFKGLAAADSGAEGGVPALVPDGYDSNRDYFDAFFETGDFKQFIQLTSKGAQMAGDVIKISKKEYKVGLLVQVNLSALRKRLEKDGIIKNAKSLFRN